MALTRTNILAELYRSIDETSGSSYFVDADLAAYANREIERIGANFPARLASFRIKGDGTTQDFVLPEPCHKIIAMEEGNSFTPPRTFVDVIGAGGLRTTLTRDIFSSYGFSFRAPDRVRVESTLSSGETRTLWAYASPGTLNTATISGTTVTATNAAITVSIGGTAAGISSAVHLNTVEITTSGGEKSYYVLNSASGTTVLLTEPFRGTTASTHTLAIGTATYLTEDWLDCLLWSVLVRLNEKEGDLETASYYRRLLSVERRAKRANLSRMALGGSERFQSF